MSNTTAISQLKRLQHKQLTTAIASNSPSQAISPELFSAYLDEVDHKVFIERAIQFNQDAIGCLSTETEGMTDIGGDKKTFFLNNRAAIKEMLERIAERESVNVEIERTSLSVLAELSEHSSNKRIAGHQVGMCLYGDDANNKYMDAVAKAAVYVVSRLAAEHFLLTALELEGEPLIEIDYYLNEFYECERSANSVGKDLSEFYANKPIYRGTGAGWALTKYIVESLGERKFAEKALAYQKDPDEKRLRGMLPSLDYINDFRKFFEFNKEAAVGWFNSYIEGEAGKQYVQGDILNSAYKLIASQGLMPSNNQEFVTLHGIAEAFYGDCDFNNEAHNLALKSLMIFTVERIVLGYKEFHQEK